MLHELEKRLIALALFCLVAAAVGYAEPVRLSSEGLDASEARIVATADGDCTVIWRQATNPPLPAMILSQRRLAGAWEDRRTVIPRGGTIARPENLCLSLDNHGQPHVVWVISSGGESRFEYAFVAESTWAYFGPLTEPTRRTIEHPVMRIGPRNQLFLVWQERQAMGYQIRSCVIDAEGLIHFDVIDGRDSLRYVVYPDLVELPPPGPDQPPRIAVVWFSLDGIEPVLEMRVWNPAEGGWESMPAPQWTRGSVDSLPIVAGSAATGIFVVGHAPQDRIDRVFFQSAAFPQTFLDRGGREHNRYPRLSAPLGDRFGVVWHREGSTGPQLEGTVIAPSGQLAPFSISPIGFHPPADPDVALSDSAMLVVWTGTQDADSARSSVFFSEIPFAGKAWQGFQMLRDGRRLE